MGQSTHGIVAYGYNVGNGAPVTGLGEDEDWRPADFTGDHYGFDFRDWAERKLLAVAGRPVEDEGYFDPEETKKYWGVWFEAEGYGENPGYMLVTFEEHSYDSPTDIDFAELERRRVEEGWDDKLAAVLEILGIEGFTYPEDVYKTAKREQSARWMLTSYWG